MRFFSLHRELINFETTSLLMCHMWMGVNTNEYSKPYQIVFHTALKTDYNSPTLKNCVAVFTWTIHQPCIWTGPTYIYIEHVPRNIRSIGDKHASSYTFSIPPFTGKLQLQEDSSSFGPDADSERWPQSSGHFKKKTPTPGNKGGNHP